MIMSPPKEEQPATIAEKHNQQMLGYVANILLCRPELKEDVWWELRHTTTAPEFTEWLKTVQIDPHHPGEMRRLAALEGKTIKSALYQRTPPLTALLLEFTDKTRMDVSGALPSFDLNLNIDGVLINK